MSIKYKLKNNVNLTLNGKITDRVEITNGILTINENDTITYNTTGWYINGVYQGEDAWYEYIVENPVKEELFDLFFDELVEA